MFGFFRWFIAAMLCLVSLPAHAAAPLQCVPYARIVSGIDLYGDAWTWWDQAADKYNRGRTPKKGAVLAFRPNGNMNLGHVAVVSKILGKGRVLIRHANWSAPGAIEEDVLAVDVSDRGDWSQVRVWFSPNDKMGTRVNPVYGFIYPDKPKLHRFEPDSYLGTSTLMANARGRDWDAVTTPSAKPASPRPIRTASNSTRQSRRPANTRQLADISSDRSLADIIADVKREARIR